MTEINRRTVILAAASISAAVSAGTLSACSPVDTDVAEMPAKFFAKVALRRLVEARGELSTNATLSLVTREGAQFFSGQDDVAEAMHRLLNVEGWSMIGDTNDVAAGGFYWTAMGPWLCSDLVKGKVPQFSMDDCNGGFSEPVLNVFVGMHDGLKIRSILVLENRLLSGQMLDGPLLPPAIEK